MAATVVARRSSTESGANVLPDASLVMMTAARIENLKTQIIESQSRTIEEQARTIAVLRAREGVFVTHLQRTSTEMVEVKGELSTLRSEVSLHRMEKEALARENKKNSTSATVLKVVLVVLLIIAICL